MMKVFLLRSEHFIITGPTISGNLTAINGLRNDSFSAIKVVFESASFSASYKFFFFVRS